MRSALLALVILSCACAADDADLRPPPVLRDAQCPYDEPGARCAYLDVPAKRSDPTSATLSLFVMIAAALDGPSDRMPIALLVGGPGASAVADGWLLDGPVREKHDIVLLDQRGAGLSEPSLHCGELDAPDVAGAGRSIDDPARRQAHKAAAASCRARYVERGVDLSAFNTVESAADIEDLRRALGVPQLNLHGSSYGTRLALEVARAFPSSVRSAFLIGTYPHEIDEFADSGHNGAAAIQAVFKACEEDPDCPDPDLRTTVEARLLELDKRPQRVEDEFGDLYYYSAANVGAHLVSMLRRSSEIVDAPLTALSFSEPSTETMGAGVPDRSRGLYLAVSCREDFPFADRDRARDVPFYMRAYSWDLSAHVAQCEGWDAPPAPAAFKEPVRSDIPMLLAVGRFDPITPPHYTRLAAETLSNSQVIELPGAGHDTQYYTPCMQDMLAGFFDDPSDEVDTSCIDDELGPPDF
jgi:pimeloyl-ACP methyl ester carboxylesterase